MTPCLAHFDMHSVILVQFWEAILGFCLWALLQSPSEILKTHGPLLILDCLVEPMREYLQCVVSCPSGIGPENDSIAASPSYAVDVLEPC